MLKSPAAVVVRVLSEPESTLFTGAAAQPVASSSSGSDKHDNEHNVAVANIAHQRGSELTLVI